jgi:plastocyanin
MVARRVRAAHRGSPELMLAGSRSNDLWPVVMRHAESRRDAVVVAHRFTYEGVPMRLITGGLTTILATLALASSTFGALRTTTSTLTGTVGPGFTITMNKKTVKPGAYVVTIHDLASIHDFHLTGPGVDKKTSVPGIGPTKWTVKLKKGTYHFVCDPHHTIMHGVLTVT